MSPCRFSHNVYILTAMVLTVFTLFLSPIRDELSAADGVPYGPIMFGMNPSADYTEENLVLFSGAFNTGTSVTKNVSCPGLRS